jgi:hypothetical protein
MKKIIISVCIVLALALLLSVTVALAKAGRMALEGEEHIAIAGAPRSVQEADEWLQLRDIPFEGIFDFGTMSGTETQLLNAKINPATGEGHVWGIVTYTDNVSGVTCSGLREGKLTNFYITAKIVAPCSDGSLLRGTLQDIELTFPPGSPAPSEVISYFDGELLSPS